MFKKLDKMLERYEKLNRLVGDPAVIAKMDEWKAYTKELADMKETVEKYTEYKKAAAESETLKQSLPSETDREMKELIEQEIAELKAKLAATDYISAKIAEGAATREEYAEKLAERAAWRARINELESIER